MLTKEEIFKELFEGESYNERRLQNLIFDLTKSAEYFLNYAMQKEDNNIDGFRNEGLNIFKYMIENNAYSSSEHKYMDLLTFRNIILNCNIKESEWLNYFIENYVDCLDPEHRVHLMHFAKAHLYCLKKEFEKSLEYISKINNDFFFFKIDVKLILLRVYYELDYIEEAFHLLDAIKHFIKNNKVLTEDFKKAIRNFIKQYKELIKIKSGQSQENPYHIKSKIEKETDIVCKFWLIEKADELIEKIKSYD